jgi:nitrite reductase/ring-hydroxylating ferredoxin subunit
MKWIRIFPSDEEARKHMEHKSTQLIVADGKRICLAYFNDSFFAVQDRCPHNGESLSKGTVNYCAEIICPWHNYRFDLKSGKATDSSCSDLETYPVRSDGSGFFIGL